MHIIELLWTKNIKLADRKQSRIALNNDEALYKEYGMHPLQNGGES